MNYEPSEKEKYIRKATQEYADRIRAMFGNDTKVIVSIQGVKLSALAEITEPIIVDDERLEIRKNSFTNDRYVIPYITDIGYLIETISE